MYYTTFNIGGSVNDPLFRVLKAPDDIDILRNTWSTYLDPTRNPPEDRPYGAKTLINACKEHKYLKVFSKRTLLRESVYNKVKKRWDHLGFDFPPPELHTFEPQDK